MATRDPWDLVTVTVPVKVEELDMPLIPIPLIGAIWGWGTKKLWILMLILFHCGDRHGDSLVFQVHKELQISFDSI